MTRKASGKKQVEETADRIHSAAIHLLRRLRRQDDGAGQGPARLSALSVLVFAGPRTLGELAAAEQVRPPTMTRIVAALEREGLVARQPDEHDGRVVRLSATPRGARLMQKARRRRISHLAGRLEPLRAAELRLLRQAARLMERVARQS